MIGSEVEPRTRRSGESLRPPSDPAEAASQQPGIFPAEAQGEYGNQAGQIAVPQEISIVTFDDSFWARYMDPPLTVIAQPVDKMGKSTMELLLARLRGGKRAQTLVFTPELIVRRSTTAPAIP